MCILLVFLTYTERPYVSDKALRFFFYTAFKNLATADKNKAKTTALLHSFDVSERVTVHIWRGLAQHREVLFF